VKIFSLKSFSVFVFAVLLFAPAKSGLGCSYIGNPLVPQNFIVAGTKTIFLGEVAAKTNFYKKTDGVKYWVQRVKFKVEKAFKGVRSGETVEVIFFEKVKRTSCDNEAPRPQIGEKWVVYDGYADESVMEYLRHSITLLSYKYSPEEDAQHLQKLEKLTANPVTTIQGQIDSAYEYELFDPGPAKDVEVVLEGNGIRTAARTNDSGFYTFENIPAGKYKVRIFLPYKTVDFCPYPKQPAAFDGETQKYFFEYEVTISAGDSRYRYFLIEKSKAPPPKETSNKV
jgi:hypothetical protein